jgi:mono/diheme cytochrome c family protein
MKFRRMTPRDAALGAIALAAAAAAACAAASFAKSPVRMSPAQKRLYDRSAAAAGTADASSAVFSAEKGQAFFQGRHKGGKPDSPSCTSCHTTDVKASGKSRAGKVIAPMAASVNPKRFTDYADVEKWFARNCPDVLGRECTLTEKGDVLAYLLSQ